MKDRWLIHVQVYLAVRKEKLLLRLYRLRKSIIQDSRQPCYKLPTNRPPKRKLADKHQCCREI